MRITSNWVYQTIFHALRVDDELRADYYRVVNANHICKDRLRILYERDLQEYVTGDKDYNGTYTGMYYTFKDWFKMNEARVIEKYSNTNKKPMFTLR